jgi:hypothetical protein
VKHAVHTVATAADGQCGHSGAHDNGQSYDITEAQLAYGAKVMGVEPGGVEAIPLAERHGSPLQLLWTWVSPNMEFASTASVGRWPCTP